MPTPRIGNLDFAKMAKLFSAALGEFSKHDFGSASYNQIIKSSGLSKGTLYYYFTSKEDIYLTLIQHSTTDLKTKLAQLTVPVSTKEDFILTSHNLFGCLVDFFHSKPGFAKFLNRVFAEATSSEHPAFELTKSLEEWLSRHIESGQKLGAVRTDIPKSLLNKLTWELVVQITDHILKTREDSDLMSGAKQAALYFDVINRLIQP
ncbi:MAG: TetR/AcrR family transcriptional regulator [Oligoflexales bacterium]